MSYILIIGAKSDIAKSLAIKYIENGYNLYLAARKSNEIKFFAKEISNKFNREVILLDFNILEYNNHKFFFDNLKYRPIGIICTVGLLGEQKIAQKHFAESQLIIDTNYTGIVSFLNIVACEFEKRKSGFIICISSVAGDRGRKKNYIYGSAKSALSTYLSGLRNRVNKLNIHVMTVKPGFVYTKMTEGMNLPRLLTSTPSEIANDIYNAHMKRKNIIYSKSIWRLIMLIIRNIPENYFKKTNI
ncbi:SDR family oxidoreductase [Flavobacteriaceae bacterium]|nr:SDR family oxidoreductase [Flavobacteriaceae bacterium]